MGTYHYGILAYGYGLGCSEQVDVKEVDQYGGLTLSWLKRDEDGWATENVAEALTRRLYESIPDADQGNTDSYDQEQVVKDRLGVKILEHGWLVEGDTASYALIASEKQAAGGDVELIDLDERTDLAKRKDFDGKLAKALEILGITPVQEKPSWLLMASR